MDQVTEIGSEEATRMRDLAASLVDIMPVAVFVIDAQTNVVYANHRLVDLTGLPLDRTVGNSVLQFVDPRDIDFAWSLLDAGGDYDGMVMGPSRIRYLDGMGNSHFTQFWGHVAPAHICPGGFIITLSPESTRDVLANAVSSVASDDPLPRTLEAIAVAGRAAPLDGIGTMLIVEPSSPTDSDRFRAVGEWPIDDELINAFGTPWRAALVQKAPQDVGNCAEVDARTGAAMATAGLPSAWVRPIMNTDGSVTAIFIVWRRTTMAVSPNQEDHLHDAIRLAQLATGQAQRRTELEEAAHRDALTGVGNRASLQDRLRTDRRESSVLFVDLDHFKKVNDTFGHGVGDEVVAMVGRRISASVRRGDEVFRTGGDEFIVVCDRHADDAHELIALADRIVEQIGAPFDCSQHRVRIGATIGIASGENRSLEESILAADRAMYVAKDRGRGGVHHADERR